MNIETAKKLRQGDSVIVHLSNFDTSNNGKKEIYGQITIPPTIDSKVNKNIYGTEYLWVAVKVGLSESVWPSNRLTKVY